MKIFIPSSFDNPRVRGSLAALPSGVGRELLGAYCFGPSAAGVCLYCGGSIAARVPNASAS
ncbi:MAG: hypothetical protein ABIL25_00830 [candidate division WOR-3 bacterium]